MLIDEKNTIDRQLIFNHCFALPLQESEKAQVNNSNRTKIHFWLNKFFDDKVLPHEVECLRASSKSQVYKVVIERKQNFIFKCFNATQNFLIESLAFTLFEGESSIPQLIDSCEDSKYLVMEYLPQPFSLQHPSCLEQIAFNLGTLHAFGSSCYKFLNKLFLNMTENRLLENVDKLSWIKEKIYFEKALKISIDYYGVKRVPLMIGDIKPEHIRFRNNQESVFIDMETFSVGLPGYLDVLSLTNFSLNRNSIGKKIWLHLLYRYLEGKNQCLPSQKELYLNYEILTLVAQSLGYNGFFKE